MKVIPKIEIVSKKKPPITARNLISGMYFSINGDEEEGQVVFYKIDQFSCMRVWDGYLFDIDTFTRNSIKPLQLVSMVLEEF